MFWGRVVRRRCRNGSERSEAGKRPRVFFILSQRTEDSRAFKQNPGEGAGPNNVQVGRVASA